MNLLEKLRTDKVTIGTSIALVVALVMKLIQGVILYTMTTYFVFSTETAITLLIGMAPSLLLLGYIVFFYQTDKTQLLLPCVFLFQAVISLGGLLEDYSLTSRLDASIIMGNGIWIVYYIFLFIVTYKGFEHITLLRVVIGAMSLYAMAGSVISLKTMMELFPEETVIIVSQAVAVVGFFAHYLATFLFVPKWASEHEMGIASR